MKFAKDGTLLGKIEGSFSIVHSLTLVEDEDWLCVANREDWQILCYRAGLKDARLFGTPVGGTLTAKGAVYAIAAKGYQPSWLNKSFAYYILLEIIIK